MKTSKSVYLFETKTKGQLVEEQIRRQLYFDLQTMFYFVALRESKGLPAKLAGVRYNVIRRPLAGGKGSIRQHQPSKSSPNGESQEEFYARLGRLIAEEPDYYFMRWLVEITADDVARFCSTFLNPVLEQLCDWWHWIDSPAGRENPFADPIHYRYPFGVYNVMLEGGSSELDEYLASGSQIGLHRTDTLFPELQ